MPEKKPTRTADLDYFYGQSSELFSFYRIPKLLFQDSRFQPLSTDAKTLYGILLDRMSLSARKVVGQSWAGVHHLYCAGGAGFTGLCR